MKLSERAEAYHRRFPKWPPLVVSPDGRWLYGVWMVGNDYRNPTRYYGAYPHGYLNRLCALFPDKKRVLHLFSGMVMEGPRRWPQEWALDNNPDLDADFCRDVMEPGWTKDMGKFDLILADPPYSEEDAAHYGTCLINRNRVVKDSVSLLEPGGHLVWLDQVYPMYRKAELKLVGTIGLIRSTNHRVRCVFIYERCAVEEAKPLFA